MISLLGETSGYHVNLTVAIFSFCTQEETLKIDSVKVTKGFFPPQINTSALSSFIELIMPDCHSVPLTTAVVAYKNNANG